MAEVQQDLTVDAAIEALTDMEYEPEEVIEDVEDGAEAEEPADIDDVEEENTAEEEVEADAEDEGDDPEEDHDADDEEEESDEPETALEAPQFLDETAREQWNDLPREAQEMVLQHDKALIADYTRKTQAVAEERKTVQAQQEQLTGRIEKLGVVLTETEQRAQYYANVDWQQAAQNLSAEEYNQHKAAAEQTFRDAQEQRSKLEAAEAEQFDAFVKEQTEIMPKVAEELGEQAFLSPDAGEKVWRPLGEYLMKSGFSEDDVRNADARMSVVAWKALQWDEYQAKKKEKPVLKPKRDAKSRGKPVRAGARASSSKRAPDKKRLERFKRTGNTQDAMKLLEQFD